MRKDKSGGEGVGGTVDTNGMREGIILTNLAINYIAQPIPTKDYNLKGFIN